MLRGHPWVVFRSRAPSRQHSSFGPISLSRALSNSVSDCEKGRSAGHLLFIIIIYPCIPLYTHVYPCIPLYTPIYSCIPLHTPIYPYIPLYTLIYPYIPMHTPVYPHIPMYTHVYPHIPLYTDCGANFATFVPNWIKKILALTKILHFSD